MSYRPNLSGKTFAYLGHFRKGGVPKAGHNTLDDEAAAIMAQSAQQAAAIDKQIADLAAETEARRRAAKESEKGGGRGRASDKSGKPDKIQRPSDIPQPLEPGEIGGP